MTEHTRLSNKQAADPVETIRAFNRFYTNQLGLLGRAFLDSRFTLTEARIIYELAVRPGLAAKTLTDELHLDPAYLSRILKKFRNDGLLVTRPDPLDQRSQLLTLTTQGLAEARSLADRSRHEIAAMLAPLDAAQQETVAKAMDRIEKLLSAPSPRDFILRPHQPGDISLVIGRQTKLYREEYGWNGEYEGLAMQIAADFLQNFKPGREHCWIAESGGDVAGSVFVIDAGASTAKLRLLYVEPFARGLGIGRALVRRCITFARDAGFETLALWTNDVLATARRLYETEGFVLVSEERHHSFGTDLNGQTWQMRL